MFMRCRSSVLASVCGAGLGAPAPPLDPSRMSIAVPVIWCHLFHRGLPRAQTSDRRIRINKSISESPAIPALRACLLSPWVAFTANEGAPFEALLERAGIHPELLQQPTAVVPFKRALCWIELAGASLGTAQLGARVGSATPIEALGAYGRALASARTLR